MLHRCDGGPPGHREAERVPAILADILRVPGSSGDEDDPVREEEADQRVPDLSGAGASPQKAVPAPARVLDEAVPLGDGLDAVTEESAGIADLLGESLPRRERISVRAVDQRVAAPHTDILMDAVARTHADVGVMAEKAGQRMADMGGGAVFREVADPAAAVALPPTPTEDLVIDDVTPDRAAQSCPHAC